MVIFTFQLQFTKIYEAIHPSENRDMEESALPLHLSVCAYKPLEKLLIHTPPLLICLADAAKTCVPVLQHDYSCFCQEWM